MSNSWDIQIGGDHYKKYKIQPMDYSMQNGLDPLQHTVIKYVTRFRDKNQPVEDLRKARHCIDMLLDIEMKLIKEDEEYYNNALTAVSENNS